jgi:uncharacterized Tic20 family protein
MTEPQYEPNHPNRPTPEPTPPPGSVRAPEPGPLGPQEERNWAVAAHLGSFVAAYVALGFLAPLAVLLMAGRRSAFVRRHAVEALNFNLTVLLYAAISAVLIAVLIGIPMLVALGVLYIVAVLFGAAAASRGEDYRYPLTIRLVR